MTQSERVRMHSFAGVTESSHSVAPSWGPHGVLRDSCQYRLVRQHDAVPERTAGSRSLTRGAEAYAFIGNWAMACSTVVERSACVGDR